jgi:hypothetical protein
MLTPTPKLCEHCEKPLAPTPAQWARGLRTANKRFCNHQCAALAKAKPVDLVCPQCSQPFQKAAWKAQSGQQVFCSAQCYAQAHAAKPKPCATCGQPFVSPSYSKAAKYCCMACVPRSGADNPNFGLRHPGLHSHSAEFRLWLSALRTGKGNPAWTGGSRTAGAWQHQTWVSQWAAQHLPHTCELCKLPAQHVHHIVPGRFFAPRLLMQFRQNLVMLCNQHQRQTVQAARSLLAQGTPRLLPFADRLPPSIHAALERGDSVSSPLPGCDYAPLGNIGEQIHAGHWQSGKA